MNIGIYKIDSLALGMRGGRWEVRWRRSYECCDAVSDERVLDLGMLGISIVVVASTAHAAVIDHEQRADAHGGQTCSR